MPYTLKQLAAELHLSPATVSLALRNSPLIADKTKEKVCALAQKRNYIRSNLGVALQAGRSRIIGYLIDGITNTFYNEVLQGAGDMAPKLDYGLLIGWAGKDERINEQQIRLMLEKDVDALIVSEHNNRISKYLDRFASRRKPVVYCTCEAPEPFSSVISDDAAAGKMAIDTLYEFGHRQIAISSRWQKRWQGMVGRCEELGMNYTSYLDLDELLALLEHNPAITAIAAYDDMEACDILFLLPGRVPEDISVIGFDGLPIGKRNEIQLTTIAQQRQTLGAKAVELAVELIGKKQIQPEKIILSPEKIIGKTVAQCKR